MHSYLATVRRESVNFSTIVLSVQLRLQSNLEHRQKERIHSQIRQHTQAKVTVHMSRGERDGSLLSFYPLW